ncbi:hypothetical protein [Plastoroseomonas hellenica]|nr:hypothetical protein [Plastoroseomonas hellenica]MBR0647273.1 hypothetical protein [Plastoroseomonas hellenica]
MRDYLLCLAFGTFLAVLIISAERCLNLSSGLEVRDGTIASLSRIATGRL